MDSILNVIINKLADKKYKRLKQYPNFTNLEIRCREIALYFYNKNPKIEFLFDICWFTSIILMINYSGVFLNILKYDMRTQYNMHSSLIKWTCFINEDLFPSSNLFDSHLANFLEKDLQIPPTIKLLFPFFKNLLIKNISPALFQHFNFGTLQLKTILNQQKHLNLVLLNIMHLIDN